MTTYNISINKELAELIEKEMEEKKFANRSEFFRDLARKYLVEKNYTIEELSDSDDDYKIIKRRSVDAKFIPLSKLIKG